MEVSLSRSEGKVKGLEDELVNLSSSRNEVAAQLKETEKKLTQATEAGAATAASM